MLKQYLSDFQRGYDYARRRHATLLAGKSPQYILELAMVFFLVTGSTADLARGIGTYYQEMGMKKIIS